MVALLERPSLATPTPPSTDRGDLRNGLLRITSLLPQRHGLTVYRVRNRHDVCKPPLSSRSPGEIAEFMEKEPGAEYVCSTMLSRDGYPEAAHWGLCLESTIIHHPNEIALNVRMVRTMWNTEAVIKQHGFGYRAIHLREDNRLYSLFVKDACAKAHMPVASIEVDGLSDVVTQTLRLAFPPESTLDDWLRFQFDGGDPPVEPMQVDVIRVHGFPLPRRAVDYDVQMGDLIAAGVAA